MRDARAMMQADPARPVVVVAATQTGAAGRHGRRWAAPRGGLWFTAGWPIGDRSAAGPAAVLAGLATARAAEAAGLDADRACLRWPNDVLADGGKLSGVLCETFETARGWALLVGVGINANLRAADLPGDLRTEPATLLELLGRPVDLDGLLESWLQAFAAGLGRVSLGRVGLGGAAPGRLDAADLREAESRLCWRGARVRVDAAGAGAGAGVEAGDDMGRCGVLAGLDAAGGLRLVEGDSGREIVVYSGEVSVRPD